VFEITLRGKKIKYNVRRSKRASRSRIDVDLRGITVVIPEDKDLDPEEFLREKKNWVLEKYWKIDDYLSRIPEWNFEEGEKFPYLGNELSIRYSDNKKPKITDKEIIIPEKNNGVSSSKETIESLYREKAREIISKKISKYEDHFSESFNKLYIRDQKTKWASCSAKKNISFNWRLLLGPEDVLEYVVVHELIHLEEPNHSRKFWKRMEEILPDYRERRGWLKDNSPELVFSKEDMI